MLPLAVLVVNGMSGAAWAGAGDVIVDDGVGGTQVSGVNIDGANNVTGVGSLTASGTATVNNDMVVTGDADLQGDTDVGGALIFRVTPMWVVL